MVTYLGVTVATDAVPAHFTSLEIDRLDGTNEGDVVVMYYNLNRHFQSGYPAMTVPAGWVQLIAEQSQAYGTLRYERGILARQIGSLEPSTWTFNFTLSRAPTLHAIHLRGADMLFDGPTYNTGTTTPMIGTSVDVSNDGSMLIFAGTESDGTTYGVPTGMTLAHNTNASPFDGTITAYQPIDAGTSGTRSSTCLGGGRPNTTMMLAVGPSGGVPKARYVHHHLTQMGA